MTIRTVLNFTYSPRGLYIVLFSTRRAGINAKQSDGMYVPYYLDIAIYIEREIYQDLARDILDSCRHVCCPVVATHCNSLWLASYDCGGRGRKTHLRAIRKTQVGCGWVANVRNDSVPIKTGGFFSQKVGFPIEKNESLLKVKKKYPKSENQSENREILMDFSHFLKALR